MSTPEWLSHNDAIIRISLRGISATDARSGIDSAVRTGAIKTRQVGRTQVRMDMNGNLLSTNYHRNPEAFEINRADLDFWFGRTRGEFGKNKGGKPPKYDWKEFDFEIVRIANQPDGLPDRPATLIKKMLQWTSDNWQESPGETVVKGRISDLYSYLEKVAN
jgi:hypothetical protein